MRMPERCIPDLLSIMMSWSCIANKSQRDFKVPLLVNY